MTNDRREVGSRTVATDGDPFRIDVERLRIGKHPSSGSDRVFNGRRKLVFRRETIVYRQHGTPAGIRKAPAKNVMRFQVAENPSAAVKEHQPRDST